MKMKNVEKKKNSTAIPLVIIGLVLVGVVAAAWWFSRSSKPPTNLNGNQNAVNASRTPPPNAPVGANPPNMLGSPTSPVTVEEFADFQCGSCGATHPVMKEIQSTYGSKIRFIFREFPLTMHEKAYDAAVAAEAAGMQGKFWAMQDQLFTNQAAWSGPSTDHKQMWKEYAQKIGLDVAQWQNDMSGISAKSRVDQDMQRGKALNVSSTPSIYINGQLVPFPEVNVAGLRRIIDAELQKVPASQAQTSSSSTAPVSAANNLKTNSK